MLDCARADAECSAGRARNAEAGASAAEMGALQKRSKSDCDGGGRGRVVTPAGSLGLNAADLVMLAVQSCRAYRSARSF